MPISTNIDSSHNLVNNFVFKEEFWHISKNNSTSMLFCDEKLTLELRKPKIKQIFYLMLGDKKTDSFKANDRFRLDNFSDSIRIEFVAEWEGECTISLFLQEFNLERKVSSRSYPVISGCNKLFFNKHQSATSLKLLFRFSHKNSDLVTLSNLDVRSSSVKKSTENKVYNQSGTYSEIPIIYNNISSTTISIGGEETNILTSFKYNSNILVVFFNGAVDLDKTPLPVFQRHSWLERIPHSSIIIMDPTIEDFINDKDRVYITWYQGKNCFFLKSLCTKLTTLSENLGIRKDNILFYGSSAGGYAAMVAATLLKGSKACVVNPQVDIRHYHKKYANKIMQYLVSLNLTDDEIDLRMSVVNLMAKEKYYPHIYFKQNVKDEMHFKQHYSLLKDAYEKHGHLSRLTTVLTDDERGHSAIPKYEEAIQDIDNTIISSRVKCTGSYPKKYLINRNIFGFTSNKSSLENFKPREDCKPFTLTYPLDWSCDPYNDRNWSFQLNAWRHFDFALICLDNNYSQSLFNNIVTVIVDWEFDAIKCGNVNDYTWYDMATGLRAMKLAFIINRLESLPEKYLLGEMQRNTIYSLANTHLDVLQKQKLSLNNHGIFQAHGQAILALVLNNKNVKSEAIFKMELLLSQQFYNDGFHVENSDKYHWFVIDTFNKFLKLDIYNESTKIKSLLQKAKNINPWTVYPDKTSLMIGDSEYKSRSVCFATASKISKCLSDDRLYLNKFFPDSGYYFIRRSFDVPSEESSLLFFQTAYKSNVHRHSDDFNILLFEYGLNILVDAGQYAYSNDKERGYVLSTKAHNCLVIDDKSYDLKDKQFYESALVLQKKEDDVFIVKTQLHRRKPDVTHSRVVFYKPSQFLVVADFLNGKLEHKYEQCWHFHQDLEVLRLGDTFTADIKEDITMNVHPSAVSLDTDCSHAYIKANNISIVKGQEEPEFQGWRSLKYRELTPNYALTNSINARKSLLVTKFIFSECNTTPVDLEVTSHINGADDIIGVVSKLFNININISI